MNNTTTIGTGNARETAPVDFSGVLYVAALCDKVHGWNDWRDGGENVIAVATLDDLATAVCLNAADLIDIRAVRFGHGKSIDYTKTAKRAVWDRIEARTNTGEIDHGEVPEFFEDRYQAYAAEVEAEAQAERMELLTTRYG